MDYAVGCPKSGAFEDFSCDMLYGITNTYTMFTSKTKLRELQVYRREE